MHTFYKIDQRFFPDNDVITRAVLTLDHCNTHNADEQKVELPVISYAMTLI